MMSAAEMEAESNGGGSGNMASASYEQLGRRHPEVASVGSPAGPPDHDNDRNNVVYFTLLTAGIGFVLPYNSFIMAADYWQERFHGKNVIMDMTMIYIIVAFTTVLLNNIFLTLIPYKVRIATGYAISFTTLVFVGICEVAWHMFNAKTAYSVNLVAISLVAVGCTIQQSSFYGFASMLPKKYTQAVMVGESLAGFLVSSNRVITKLMIEEDNRISTMIFFLTSSAYIAISYVLHSVTIESPFVKHHLRACAKIILRPNENQLDESMADSHLRKDTDNGDGSSSIMMTDGQMHAMSFSNPVYDLSNPSAEGSNGNQGSGSAMDSGFTTIPIKSESTVQVVNNSCTPGVAYKVEHHLTPTGCSMPRYSSFRRGLDSRIVVAHLIYPYMCAIALAYCVTLSLYPGLESEIKSCKLQTWMPVLLMFTFNTSDMIGKILAAIPYAWSRRQLTLMSGLRTLLIPLLLLCCTPRERPVISGEAMSFFFTACLGLSNGMAGSLPMMLAPSKVPSSLRETAGNMMTLSYNVGLILGSILAYMFEAILGPPVDKKCPQFPFAPPLNTTMTPLTTTTAMIRRFTTTIASTTTTTTSTTTMTPPTTAMVTFANYLAGLITTTAATLTTTTMGHPLGTGNLSISDNSTQTVLVNAISSNTAYKFGH